MMCTIDSSRRQTELDVARDLPRQNGAATRVFLQPIAAPSILGLFGFAGATFIVASNLAGWWGTPKSALALAPGAAMFTSLAQFLAGMWAYRARDAIATAMHGTWGAFWLAYGILNVLVAGGRVRDPRRRVHLRLARLDGGGRLGAGRLGCVCLVRRDGDDARRRCRRGRPPPRQVLASGQPSRRSRDAPDRARVGRAGRSDGPVGPSPNGEPAAWGPAAGSA